MDASCGFILQHSRSHPWYHDVKENGGSVQICEKYNNERQKRQVPILRRFPCGDTGSDAALDWIKSKITDCEFGHESCKVSNREFLPTRLVDLGAFGSAELDSDVILRDSHTIPDHESHVRYIALSYCWGGHTPECQTTNETLNDRKSCIPWSMLPKTFQDTANLARRLGIRYIWIDSLCIIQGDMEDWLKESAKMSDVYGQSYLTVAATHSPDALGGLYVQSTSPVRIVTVPELGWDIWARPLFRHWPGEFLVSLDWDKSRELPLLWRAWAFQERMVSPHVVFFAHNEVGWECIEETACECGELEAPGLLFGGSNRLHECKSSLKKGSGNVLHAMKMWSLVVVNQYSDMNITIAHDRLPALSAIAKRFQVHHPHLQYLAGLWFGRYLPHQLLWIAGWDTRSVVRPDQWCPPTWSWTSVQGTAIYVTESYDADQIMFDVVYASCQYLDDHNPFGIVLGGLLTVNGRLLEVTMTPSLDSWSYSRSYKWTWSHREYEFVMHPDLKLNTAKNPMNDPPPYRCTLLAVAVRYETEGMYFTCICLQPSRTDRFQRIGLASTSLGKSSFKEDTFEPLLEKFSEPKTIVIE
ncbi:heterokaryon incompatibility protein-domain-containing protein [Podospora australis]|uniref:Heterokaryon incompatibility protein-domain-containing protein n=1 Tax=Podospora australis TaxID=1536484 RepID=A0AAN6WS86_9PEZI|nr:heterokaryon incompatibility protein-domain-containing protein [Podospora australis]